MARLILFNKPYGVLSQFTDNRSTNDGGNPGNGRTTLKSYIDIDGCYPAGRLDLDSEGLLILTDDGQLQARISAPQHKMEKCYQVQVEAKSELVNSSISEAIQALVSGVSLKDGPIAAKSVRLLGEAECKVIGPRDPPIRVRKHKPTCWLEVTVTQGRNRMVRRMLAAVGHPVLRLVRTRIGPWSTAGLAPGQWRMEHVHAPASKASRPKRDYRKTRQTKTSRKQT